MRIEFICPFCNKRASADTIEGELTHEMPTCVQFDKERPLDEYLTEVRLEMARKCAN